jgi:hypothetical protein
MFENVLFLEKMGCDFRKDEPAKSDIKNYRVRTHGEIIPGKDNNLYFLEFSLWRNRLKPRYTHKTTGKPLKHVKYDIINPQAVAIDTEFTNDNGCWRNCKLEQELSEKNYSYTQADILTIVNEISINTYNKIIFAPSKAVAAIPQILKIAGYREKYVIENLKEITIEQADKYYLIYRYYSTNNDFFDYDIKSNKITM